MTVPRIITLCTDFGTADGRAAALSGVLVSIAEELRLVTISHDIPVDDILGAQRALQAAVPTFPALSVHLVCVSAQQTARRGFLAARLGDQFFVAPNNGLVTPFLNCSQRSVVTLANPLFQRSTGPHEIPARDILAPAAAYLASGIPLEELGPFLAEPLLLLQGKQS